jgi:NADH-quinone oxidoreductase subunit L
MMNFIIFLGASTVLITSVLGAFQYDIKKIIAFSTCSQLGYMMTIIGSSYFSLAYFHLLTHAFFKALLFLTAGSVIHLMQGEQDLRRLAGSLAKRRRNVAGFSFTQVAFLVGTLAITGLFFFSGYYSKELILYALVLALSTKASFFG